jgi:hypothetical protein
MACVDSNLPIVRLYSIDGTVYISYSTFQLNRNRNNNEDVIT